MSRLNAFDSSLEHILAELSKIDFKLHPKALKARPEDSDPDGDEFRGLYMSEEGEARKNSN